MTSTTDRIVEKYRKLMSMAADQALTEELAALYASKAQELLAQHGLSMADVPEVEREDHIAREDWAAPYAEDAWRRHVALQAARLYFCDMIWSDVWTTVRARRVVWAAYEGRWVQPGEEYGTFKKGFTLVGRPHNIVVCREMCTYLFDVVVRLARRYSGARSEQLAFMRGCGERLADRLHDLWQQNQPRRAAPSGGLPALYQSEADLVRAFIEDSIRTHRIRSQGTDVSGEHSLAGRLAADDVSLSPQVASAATGAMMLSHRGDD